MAICIHWESKGRAKCVHWGPHRDHQRESCMRAIASSSRFEVNTYEIEKLENTSRSMLFGKKKINRIKLKLKIIDSE